MNTTAKALGEVLAFSYFSCLMIRQIFYVAELFSKEANCDGMEAHQLRTILNASIEVAH
jgi:hypothetical protein